MAVEDELTQYVVFRLGKEEYGFDVSVVREIHNMDNVAKVHRAAAHIEGVINLRGKLLTVVNLRKRFGMGGEPAVVGGKIVVIDAPDAPVGFMVDEVTEVARIAKGSVEKAPPYVVSGIEAQYVLGIAKHEDGRLITLLDPVKVLELSNDDAASTPER